MNKREYIKMFNEYADPIYKFAYFRLNDKEKAEDITSIVFTKAWENRESYKGPSQQAWIFTIARNTLIDSYRKNKESLIDEDHEIESDENLEHNIDKQMAVKQLQSSMNKLPDDLRDIVELRYIQGLSVKNCAERLGLSEANIRVKQHRALKKLRILYEKTV